MSDTGVGETRQTKLSALGTNVMPETIGVQAEGQDRTENNSTDALPYGHAVGSEACS